VAVHDGAAFAVGPPARLFPAEYPFRNFSNLRAGIYRGDVMPDGRHFVTMQALPSEPLTEINVVLNWARAMAGGSGGRRRAEDTSPEPRNQNPMTKPLSPRAMNPVVP